MIYARDLKIDQSFKRKNDNRIYKRIKFENKLTMLFRCIDNLIAYVEAESSMYCIPLNELVEEKL
jgi:hypothetical protein